MRTIIGGILLNKGISRSRRLAENGAAGEQPLENSKGEAPPERVPRRAGVTPLAWDAVQAVQVRLDRCCRLLTVLEQQHLNLNRSQLKRSQLQRCRLQQHRNLNRSQLKRSQLQRCRLQQQSRMSQWRRH